MNLYTLTKSNTTLKRKKSESNTCNRTISDNKKTHYPAGLVNQVMSFIAHFFWYMWPANISIHDISKNFLQLS